MKNQAQWQPSKFVWRGQHLVPSPHAEQVGLGSRFIAGLQATLYQQLIQQHATGHILDLGCGHAPLYLAYQTRCHSVTLVDWEHSRHSNPYLDIACDINAPLPLVDNAFDTLLCTDVLEHLHNPTGVFMQMARVLKPHGKLLLTVPFFYWLHEEPHDYHRYTQYRLQQLCADNQLTVLELTPYGGALDVILDITAKQCTRFKALSAIHLAIARLLHHSTWGTKWNERTQQQFPLGYVLVAQKPG